MASLGRLEKIALRIVWTGEATDFTPWLAESVNLALLGDTIGLDLELETTEKNVGPFRADIVCKDTALGGWVLIENQLERTDHNHLGQLLTYAAGLNAVTIVWIAERFTEEHRAALDWLNEITDNRINFFGLEIELWRIANSPVAPKFNMVSKPNDWTKSVIATRQAAESGNLSETQQLQLKYWTALRDHLQEHQSFIKSQKPLPQHWTYFAIGRSHFQLIAYINTREDNIGVGLIITGADAKAHYHLLAQDQAAIESEIGNTLEWRELPDNKQSDITLYNREVDPTELKDWPRQHQWLVDKLEAFHKALSQRIRALNAADYVLDSGEIVDD